MSRLLEIALSQYGIKELGGPEDNPEIMKYFKEIGVEWAKDSDTAWCSAFVNWCAKKTGFEYSGKLDARSWLKLGTKVKTYDKADIVVLWRESPDSWKGHVGVPINEDEDFIWILGGNQSNMVKISPYPKDRLLAYIKLYPI